MHGKWTCVDFKLHLDIERISSLSSNYAVNNYLLYIQIHKPEKHSSVEFQLPSENHHLYTYIHRCPVAVVLSYHTWYFSQLSSANNHPYILDLYRPLLKNTYFLLLLFVQICTVKLRWNSEMTGYKFLSVISLKPDICIIFVFDHFLLCAKTYQII